MSDHLPRALGDVLTYLDGIGFDHLYTSQNRSGPGNAVPDARGAAPVAKSKKGAGREAPAMDSGGPASKTPTRRDSTNPAPPSAVSPSAVSPSATGNADSGAHASPASGRPEGGERLLELDRVRERALACTACALSRGRHSVVFGDGFANADLMLVGEGPGAQEDRKGLPFVGPAGALLTRILQAIDIGRDEVYIANIVKCRPPGNRDPAPAEIAACSNYLESQIDLVRPKLLVALGRVAAQSLLGVGDSLGSLRGRWHEVRGVPMRATYHPAALLHNPSNKRPTWEDMQIIRDRLIQLR